jgi:aminodeoxyfutalosine deaminase
MAGQLSALGRGDRPLVAGIFSGAGLSHAPPSSLPLGEEFHRQLREIAWSRAAPLLGDLVDHDMLDVLRTSKINFLARIENTAPGTGAGALRCMSVAIPNEPQLLAAVHLAQSGVHVTMNFDDGIERAFALLSGDVELPDGASMAQREALGAWRACFPAHRPRLVVCARAERIASSTSSRPLLVKLHGSMGEHPDGVTLPAAAITDEPDAGDLGGYRRMAIEVVASVGFVLVTGYSGNDLASRTALLERLARGRFLWVAPQVDPDVRSLLEAIDASQPMLGRAIDAIRATLPMQPPTWPDDAGPSFEDRIASWGRALPPEVAAEALAWALADAGHPDHAAEALRLLVAAGAGSRTRMRLADALVRRRWGGDIAAGRRMMLRVAAARDERGLRAYALARWIESTEDGSDRRPGRSHLVLSGVQAGVALVHARKVHRSNSSKAAIQLRSTTVAIGAVLGAIEGGLPRHGRPGLRRSVIETVAVLAGRSARHVLRASRNRPSGRRRALLERQLIELDAVVALLRGRKAPRAAPDALARLMEVFEHVADTSGMADAAGTQALVAFAARDIAASLAALRVAARLRPEPIGVVGMTAKLVRPWVEAEAGRPASRRRASPSRSPAPSGPASRLEAFVRRLPKVELHVHLDGCVAPEMVAALARRNGDHRLPWTADGVRAWLRFNGYRDFLNAHVLVCDQLRRPEDFFAVAVGLGRSLAEQNVRYAEVAISPAAYASRGVDAGELFAALEDARTTVERRDSVRLRWSATAGTRLGPRQAIETVEMVLAHSPRGVVSVGLAGLELAASRARFREAFDLAADAGLHRIVHAGEAGGPQSVRQAIDELGAERIGHGIRCLDDQALVRQLRDGRIPLEVCMTSNVRTGLVARMDAHPLPALLRSGLQVSLNTDDPAMFGTSLVGEYLDAARLFDLSASDLADLARSAVRGAFMDPDDASALLREIDAVALPVEATLARPNAARLDGAPSSVHA